MKVEQAGFQFDHCLTYKRTDKIENWFLPFEDLEKIALMNDIYQTGPIFFSMKEVDGERNFEGRSNEKGCFLSIWKQEWENKFDSQACLNLNSIGQSSNYCAETMQLQNILQYDPQNYKNIRYKFNRTKEEVFY
ncbi:hypothetical protein ACYRE2_07145 [Listeria seeligeri]